MDLNRNTYARNIAPAIRSGFRDFYWRALGGGLLIAGVIATGAACGRRPHTLPQPQLVALTTADGATLQADYHAPAQKPVRAIIFIPEEGATRANWLRICQRAAIKGYAALALDLRGHGGSGVAPGQPVSSAAFTPQDWRACANDIAAAILWLHKSGIAIEDIAIAGEGTGGAIALYHAARQPAVGAVVMVSPGLDDAGIDTREEITRLQDCPVLLLAADGDAYAASACTTLKKAAPALCEIRHYLGTAHGTLLFDNSETATEELFLWLDQMMTAPGTPPKS